MAIVKIVKRLTSKGYPVHSKKYATSHEDADIAEKRANPKAYNCVNKLERKLKPKEIMSKATKRGVIEVERKFSKPKSVERSLITHEKVEHKHMTKRK